MRLFCLLSYLLITRADLLECSIPRNKHYQVSTEWVFNIYEALSHIHKIVKIRKFFAPTEKCVKCRYNSFGLSPRNAK